ncbi:enolase C-terminal domain-like protein [Pseudonocardia sp. DLS-67]
MQYVRPDVCMVGGITAAKKVAALAEARHVGVIPHNPLSPVSTAACLQIAAGVPNFAIQELPLGEDRAPKKDAFSMAYSYDGRGFLDIPTAPGIGVELLPDATEAAPRREWGPIVARLHVDGSVVDQ